MDFTDEEDIEWLMATAKTVDNLVENINVPTSQETTPKVQDPLECFLSILNSVFSDKARILGDFAYGTLDDSENLWKLVTKLKTVGYFFVKRTTRKKKESPRILTKSKKLPFADKPFQVLDTLIYYCHRKMRTHNEKVTSENNVVADYPNQSKCNGILIAKELQIFPGLNSEICKKEKAKMLKSTLKVLTKSPEMIETKRVTSIQISLPHIHNHDPYLKGHHLTDEVKALMHTALLNRKKTIPEVQQVMKQTVKMNYDIKNYENSAFFPSHKVIYNHLRKENGLIIKRRLNNLEKLKINKVKSQIDRDLKCISDFSNSNTDLEVLHFLSRSINRLTRRFCSPS